MALNFPDIDPVAIAVGPLQIRWYALAYLVGILLGWIYARYNVKRDAARGLRPNADDLDDFLPYAVLGVILGGRLGYVLFYQPAYYFSNPGEIFQVWNGGMSFHGGASGVIIALILYSLLKKIPLLRLSDIACASVPIGLFTGRLANFINGELYGRPADVPWAMVFPSGGEYPRHPSQLYEAALEGALLFIVLGLLIRNEKIRQKAGIISGVFLMGYGVSRFTVEFFREPDSYLGFLAGGMTMGQLLCIPMVLFGMIVTAYGFRTKREPAAI